LNIKRFFKNFFTDVQVSLEKIYNQFFTLGLAGSDLTATKASFKSFLESLNVNTAQVDNYVAALQSYLAIVVTNPTFAQKAALTSQLNLFDPAEATFVKSFEGLANIDTDGAFIANPLNVDFNSKRAASTAAKTTLRAFPEQTYVFFSNPATATMIAQYVAAAIATSDRIKSGR
jgi:hypothetical protein